MHDRPSTTNGWWRDARTTRRCFLARPLVTGGEENTGGVKTRRVQIKTLHTYTRAGNTHFHPRSMGSLLIARTVRTRTQYVGFLV